MEFEGSFKRTRLRDCATFQKGYVNPSQLVRDYFGSEIKWLRAVDLNDSFVTNTSRCLSKKGFESAGKSALLFEPGTIAISKSGTIGRLGILMDYMCGNRAVINIRVNETCYDNRFIFYTLRNLRSRITELAEGSVQKNLYISVLGDLEIWVPHLLEQRKIGEILSALDNRIESLKQSSTVIEQIAQTLFKSWFVDFDPVRAKAEADVAVVHGGHRRKLRLSIASSMLGDWTGLARWTAAIFSIGSGRGTGSKSDILRSGRRLTA